MKSATDTNGLGIYDIGPIGDRAPVTRVRRIGKVSWKDGTIGQHAIPIRSGGRPYVVFVDEHGHGGTRIIDVSDETRPRVVSKLTRPSLRCPGAGDGRSGPGAGAAAP